MPKQDPIDDLFRRKLAGYKVKPSDERRDALIRDAAKVVARRSATRWWIAGSGAGLLILSGAGLLLYEQNRVEKPVVLSIKHTENKATLNIKSENDNKNILFIKRSNEVNKIPAVKKEVVNMPGTKAQINETAAIPKSSITTVNNKVTATESMSSDIHLNTKAEISNNVTSIAEPSSQPRSTTNVTSITEPSVETQSRTNVPSTSQKIVTDTSFSPQPAQEQNVSPEAQSEGEAHFFKEKKNLAYKWGGSAGVSYMPEWMFNTYNDDKFVNNVGVEGTVHFGPFSLRTGVGLSITDGSDEINALTNPYLGTYKALDSIVFNWDAKHDKLVPVIYTTSTKAYDTSVHNNYTYNKKRYTYLQVPLVLGYDFWQNKWLSLGVRAGAVMSILLKTENISSTFESGQDRIVTINSITPGRILVNWQETGGIDASFRLSPRLSIEVEPDLKYYFNSIYESPGTIKKPWSFGVRTAFTVKL